MITIEENPYLISRSDVDKKFDGRWVLLHYKDMDPADGHGNTSSTGGTTPFCLRKASLK
jgi:hypothetical protein